MREILTDTFLDSKRKIGDTKIDAFISNVLKNNELLNLNSIFQNLVYDSEIKTDSMPKEFKEYFEENSKLPDFFDQRKIELAQDCFRQFGPSIIVAYFCKSLPECYACGNGAEVLFQTGRLTNHTRRRIAQTAQFVIDVMSPEGLSSKGKGISTSLKVRLVHASIRHYLGHAINQGKVDFDIAKLGFPINQEDLVGTMLAFSVVVISGIESLGMKLTFEEKEAILHLWKCVGYIIGIDEDILPNDYIEAELLWQKITDRHFLETEAAIILNNDLIKMLDEVIPDKQIDDVVLILMNHLIEDGAKKAVNLPSKRDYKLLAWVTYLFSICLFKLDSDSIFTRFFSNYVNLKVMNALKDYVSQNENIAIVVPPGLTKDWNNNNSFMNILKKRSK